MQVRDLLLMKWKIILGAAVLLVIMLAIVFFGLSQSPAKEGDLFSLSAETVPNDEGSAEETVQVEKKVDCSGVHIDVSGSVAYSGVYCLAEGSIVRDGLAAAGDVSDDACKRWIERNLNRSQPLFDSMKIYIPHLNDPECMIAGVSAESTYSAPTASVTCSNEGININTGSVSELETLPGVGPSLAQKIIEARPYSSIEELNTVSGIGDSTFTRLKPLVCI